MEFLGINLTKGSSFFLHAIHSSIYWHILKKIVPLSDFKNPNKKNPRNKKTRVYSWIAFVEGKNEGRRPDKNSRLIRLEFMPRNLD